MDGRMKAYQAADTLGKSQIDLILKVYDGALSAYRQASEYYADEKFDEGYEQLQRAKKFLTHLYTTLDLERGGEVAANLGKLYAFVINQTQVAESTKEISLLRSNIEILDNLRTSWCGIRDNEKVTANASRPASAEEARPLTVSG